MDAEVTRLMLCAREVTRRSLRSWVSAGAKAFSYRAGLLPKLARQQHVVAPAIIFYHKVQRRSVGLWGEPVLGVDEFERHAAFLSREYQPVKLSELVAALRSGSRLPERAVVLTFDDGYRNNRQLAAPILRHYGIPAMLFLATGLVGTDRWMWGYELEKMFREFPLEWIGTCSGDPTVAYLCSVEPDPRIALMACVGYLKAIPHARMLEVMARLRERFPVELDEDNRFLAWNEVRELRSYGFELGAHTVNHPILVRQSPDEAEREIVTSARQIERELGAPPTAFSYPNGAANPEVIERVGRHFEVAVTTRPDLCSPFDSLLTLPRIGAPNQVGELAFELARWCFRYEDSP